MTETEAKEAEILWGRDQQRQQAVSTLSAFGLTEQAIDNQLKAGAKTDAEALKSILLSVADSGASSHDRKMAHFQLAIEAERNGLPFLEHLACAARYELLRHQEQGVQKVKILAAGEANSCPSCQSQNGRVFTITNALHQMPIPCAGCTRTLCGDVPGFCRCGYVAAFD
ncbi:MAG TPA: hypothetical protein PK620_11735 [Denitromonas sp.]|uniref:hypothetical protein n=1 Tax=Denitromonas sp. TaxID=2734609 RepID=UPI001E0D06BD|nr:hypothetical protein [Rhodocyclaceae bacterium]HQV15580.1 hypothetical protein [Denitromonas sp.]